MKTNSIRYLLMGLLLVPLFAFGFEKSDIKMESYTQSWKDKKGSLVVKNNTTTKIEHIVFVINYSDTIGNVIKSERFSRGISIAPNGKTTIKIPVFEENKYRDQFKIQDEYGRTVVKVGFELIEYNNETYSAKLGAVPIIGFWVVIFLVLLLMWLVDELLINNKNNN